MSVQQGKNIVRIHDGFCVYTSLFECDTEEFFYT